MSLQAIIMAGGEGTRLRPLTEDLPKPLVPLCNEPVMGYALKLLKRHGFDRVGVTLWYLPNEIRDAFGRGDAYDLKLTYFEEHTPLGTAGSVKMAKEQLTETFLVLSGDGLTDCDLSSALAFHRQKKALATLVLKRVQEPLPYGVVLTDGEGRITKFVEKPGWSRVYSDLVNTGIYILEPEIFRWIPDQGTPDFGKDIFPALLKERLPLYGWETQGYWCDVGHQGAYLSAQRALMAGEADLPCAMGISDDAQVDPTAAIGKNCVIGPGSRIGPGAVLENAVIGAQCVIGPGARITDSCLWDRVSVGEKARAEGSVLCTGAKAGPGAHIAPGCALGSGASVGKDAGIRPGVRIGPHFKVAPGATAAVSVLRGDLSAPLWSEAGALCDNAAEACQLCGAYLQLTRGGLFLVGHQAMPAMAAVAAGTLSSLGTQVMVLGETTAPMTESLIRLLKAKGGIFAAGQRLMFFTEKGELLSPAQMTQMDALLLRQVFPPEAPGSITRMNGAEETYLAALLPPERSAARAFPAVLFSPHPLLLRLGEKGLKRINGISLRTGAMEAPELMPGETGFFLTEDGRGCGVRTKDAIPTPEQKHLLLLSLCLKRTGRIFDLPGVPRGAEELGTLEKEDDSPECHFQKLMLGDGLCALFQLTDVLKEKTLNALLKELPETHIFSRDVFCSRQDKGRILREFCDGTAYPRTLGEGVRFQTGQGYATVLPDAHRDMVHIVSESRDSEFARELCDLFYDRAERMVNHTGAKTP